MEKFDPASKAGSNGSCNITNRKTIFSEDYNAHTSNS